MTRAEKIEKVLREIRAWHFGQPHRVLPHEFDRMINEALASPEVKP